MTGSCPAALCPAGSRPELLRRRKEPKSIHRTRYFTTAVHRLLLFLCTVTAMAGAAFLVERHAAELVDNMHKQRKARLFLCGVVSPPSDSCALYL